MIHKKLITISLVLLVLLSCAAPVSEKVRLPGEFTGWKLGHKSRDRLDSSTRWEHIPEHEYISNWSRLFTIEFYDTRLKDPEILMNKLKSRIARRCPSLEWKVLEKQAGSILYEWHSRGCTRYQERHELARLIRGQQGMHRVAYTEKTRQIAPQTYQLWKKKLLGAYLETGSE